MEEIGVGREENQSNCVGKKSSLQIEIKKIQRGKMKIERN
jgi:hypothetical protein